MIDVATLSVIRRWALREQLSIREIARRTGLSRNTIRKYLRAGEAEPHYAKRVSPSKLDPFASKLSGWLKTEAGRSRKQRPPCRAGVSQPMRCCCPQQPSLVGGGTDLGRPYKQRRHNLVRRLARERLHLPIQIPPRVRIPVASLEP